MEQRLSMVSLGVENVAESTAFYDRLGWKKSETASNDAITFIQLGGIMLGLYGRGPLAEDIGIEDSARTDFSGITLAHNTRSKEQVDDVLSLVVNAGAKLLKPGQDVFWGGYSGYFADPDGHIWEVAWNPFLEISENGAIILPD